MRRPHTASGWLQLAAIVLALAGIVDATYLTVTHATGNAPACLAGGHGCETVAASKYAEIAGVRVSLIGLVGYVVLLALALVRHPVARSLALAGALFAVVFSGYLTYLEIDVIHAICQWCVGSAVIAVALLGVHLAWALREI